MWIQLPKTLFAKLAAILPPSMILNMSITGSAVILLVLLARLLLKKAPTVFSYALWVVVLFRLLCPVSLASNFSLLRLLEPVSLTSELAMPGRLAAPAANHAQFVTSMEYVHHEVAFLPAPELRQPAPDQAAAEPLPQIYTAAKEEQPAAAWTAGTLIWLLGIGSMAVYSAVSYFKLRHQLVGAVPLWKHIYLADGIGSPFVLGVLRPKIYLPSALAEEERGYIILHEQHHIRRCDHIVKLLAYFALCLHWFNPLVWAAFVLFSKDMEMSCDEAVVKKLGEHIRADYCSSLLSLATGRRRIAGMPLAFGEGNTKERIKNMISWKKPKTWITVIAAVISLAVVTACAGNPAAQSNEAAANESAVEPEAPVETEDEEKIDAPQDEEHSSLKESPAEGEECMGDEQSELVKDLAYYLELAAGLEFRDVTAENQSELMAEYGELLAGYTFLARESMDGEAVYLLGQFQGTAEENPLSQMYEMEVSVGEDMFQIIYREDQAEAAELAWMEPEAEFPASVGYRIGSSRLRWSLAHGIVMIQPTDVTVRMDAPYYSYLHTANGRAYIEDAVSRGIDLCERVDTYLEVYQISAQFGEISERIPLTVEEAADILAETRVNIQNGFGFSASLNVNGETTYYDQRSGIPQTVLDLAVERCGYRFEDPSMISDTIREASLECDWLEEPIYASEEDLPRLREILKNAELGFVGGCGYSAKLTLNFIGGETMTVFKGCDGCDTVVFGSFSGYFLGDAENTEFWKIFGLDIETKLPLG